MTKPLWFGTCETTGKRSYADRKTAKTALRRMPRKQGHYNVYACGDHWHYGHLPAWIVNGQISRNYLNREIS